MDEQVLQVKQKHEPKMKQEAVRLNLTSYCILLNSKITRNRVLQIEVEYLNSLKNKGIKRPIGFEDLPEAIPGPTNKLLDFKTKKMKKRYVLREHLALGVLFIFLSDIMLLQT